MNYPAASGRGIKKRKLKEHTPQAAGYSSSRRGIKVTNEICHSESLGIISFVVYNKYCLLALGKMEVMKK